MRVMILVLSLLLTGCVGGLMPYHEVAPLNSMESGKGIQGIWISGTYSPMQFLLNGTEGVYVKIDDQPVVIVPWMKWKFFALTAGEHAYSMRINYVISTPSTGRFTLASGQQLSTVFKVPQNAQVEAPIVFTDFLTNKEVEVRK